jgi:hypothetical protein
MKRVLYSDIYEIKVARCTTEICTVVREARSPLTTYNQIMARYEARAGKLGVIFIASRNNIVFQHLPLFCSHFNIQLYAIADEDAFNRTLGTKYVDIVGIEKDDPAYKKFLSLVERGLTGQGAI